MAEITENSQAATEEQKGSEKGFEVRLDAFSGPLDLLCHLVDMREMDPAKLNLTELVSQYVNFLLTSGRSSLNEMAEFFSFASRLMLRKVHALFPSQEGIYDRDDEGEEPDDGMSEEELRRMLENFRPYRAAAERLAALQQKRERCFVRIVDEDSTPFYDLGDLYSLSSLWWSLLEQYEERARGGASDEDSFIEDIPDAIPDECQVDQRMSDLQLQLKEKGRLDLGEMLYEKSKKLLIVTLLALLEMSRLGMIKITQNETFGDVEIVPV